MSFVCSEVAGTEYLKQGDLMIGKDKGDVVVFDETNIGAQKGIRKPPQSQVRSTPRSRPLVRKRIAKRLPARTVWVRSALKRPASLLKRPSVGPRNQKRRLRRKPKGLDRRSDGRWLWAAVLVGNKKDVYTHANGEKRFTFKMLPRKETAPNGKPRGLRSIRATIGDRIHKGAFVVFDKWRSSVSAVTQLGYKHAPAVNHSAGWRDSTTGFHSNDVESEFNRLKHFIRGRYGALHFIHHAPIPANSGLDSPMPANGGPDSSDSCADLDEGDLHEYTFYTNVGQDMGTIMAALGNVNGGLHGRYAF